jgi:hypothetical protein
MSFKASWQLLKTIFTKWLDDDPFQLAAALSYYTLFSLSPLLVISIAVAGFAFEREAAQNQIVQTIQGLIGRESAETVQSMILWERFFCSLARAVWSVNCRHRSIRSGKCKGNLITAYTTSFGSALFLSLWF